MFAVNTMNQSNVVRRSVILVAYLLRDGRPRRYSEIHSQIRGISQHALTQILRQLELEGMLVHNVYSSMPPKVEYALTKKGKDVLERFMEMGEQAMQKETE